MVLEGDSTHLYYARARWYDLLTHRFMTQDPIGLEGGVNPYSFAGNDPVNSSDPFGLEECSRAKREAGYSEVTYTDDAGDTHTTCAAPAIKTTGGPEPNWPAPWSPNFGNPFARGGDISGSAPWGGAPGSQGATFFIKTERFKYCQATEVYLPNRPFGETESLIKGSVYYGTIRLTRSGRPYKVHGAVYGESATYARYEGTARMRPVPGRVFENYEITGAVNCEFERGTFFTKP